MLDEPAGARLLERMSRATTVAVGAPPLVEATLVLASRLRKDPRPLLEGFLRRADVEVIPFGRERWEEAGEAFQRYGKGGHPAGLHFGNCLAYAVAKVARMPLLFAGDDFARTDITPA